MTDSTVGNSKVMAMRRMSGDDFLALGAEQIVFVKPVTASDGLAFGVFSATGEALGTAESIELAEATAFQNDFSVAMLH